MILHTYLVVEDFLVNLNVSLIIGALNDIWSYKFAIPTSDISSELPTYISSEDIMSTFEYTIISSDDITFSRTTDEVISTSIVIIDNDISNITIIDGIAYKTHS